MFIAGLFRWWYADGWKLRAQKSMNSLEALLDYFSIGLLIKTMFSLFRQDGAGKVDGSFDLQIKAFFGRIISRLIGAAVRTTVLIFGMITIAVLSLYHLLLLIVWFIAPIIPLVGFTLAVSGWVPWR